MVILCVKLFIIFYLLLRYDLYFVFGEGLCIHILQIVLEYVLKLFGEVLVEVGQHRDLIIQQLQICALTYCKLDYAIPCIHLYYYKFWGPTLSIRIQSMHLFTPILRFRVYAIIFCWTSATSFLKLGLLYFLCLLFSRFFLRAAPRLTLFLLLLNNNFALIVIFLLLLLRSTLDLIF